MGWDARGDIIVVLPGITGSVLQRDGRDVWGLSIGAGLRAVLSGGASIADLALDDDPFDRDTPDGVVADRICPDAHLVPGLWKIDGYSTLGAYVRRTLLVQEGVDYIEFAYDWRRDNRVAARRLREESARWLHARRQTFPNARLVLLAHSMGGLVARYFLEVLGGWRDTRTLITIGTPHRGSLNALDYLVNGYRRAFGLVDLSSLMRTFTSVHQLLPIYPCLSLDGGPLRRLSDPAISIPGLDPTRVAAADAFHREIEDAVQRNVDDEDYRDRGYRLHPVVGSEQPTSQSASWSGGVLTMRHDYPDDGDQAAPLDLGGDGTVPRVSATPIEHSDRGGEWFSGARHSSLQNTDHVLVQIRRALHKPVDLGRLRAGAPITVALDLDDSYPAGESPLIRVRPSVPTELVVSVEELTVPGVVARPPVSVALGDGWQDVAVAVGSAGCYRVRVTGGDDVEPASDLFVVA